MTAYKHLGEMISGVMYRADLPVSSYTQQEIDCKAGHFNEIRYNHIFPSREVIMIVYEPYVITDVGDSFQWLH